MSEAQSPAVRKCSECSELFQDWQRNGRCDECDRRLLREKYLKQLIEAKFQASILRKDKEVKKETGGSIL